jgi:hypothetical protein
LLVSSIPETPRAVNVSGDILPQMGTVARKTLRSLLLEPAHNLLPVGFSQVAQPSRPDHPQQFALDGRERLAGDAMVVVQQKLERLLALGAEGVFTSRRLAQQHRPQDLLPLLLQLHLALRLCSPRHLFHLLAVPRGEHGL